MITHIENVTYGEAGDAMGLLFTSLTGGGTRLTRPLRWAGGVFSHPARALRLLWKRGWARRTVILLVMQTLNNSMALKPIRVGRRRLVLTTEQNPDNPNPTWIPAANEAAERVAEKISGIPQSNLPEAILNTPATAHILGGAVISPDPSHGVVDLQQRVHGYQNLLVCDGSVIPANPGVNPSPHDHGAGRARDDLRARVGRGRRAFRPRARGGGGRAQGPRSGPAGGT